MDYATPSGRLLISKTFAKRQKLRRAILLGVAPVFFVSLAHAQTDTWLSSTGGSWTDGTKWSDGAPPSGDPALFDLGSTTGYTINVPATGVTFLDVATDTVTLNLAGALAGGMGEANIGFAAGQVGSLDLLGAHDSYYSPMEGFSIGINGGSGEVTTSVAISTEYGGYSVGIGAGSQGTFNVNGTGLSATSTGTMLEVGNSGGVGTANFNAGTDLDLFSMDIGAAGNGTVSLSNGSSIGLTNPERPALTVGTVNGTGQLTLDNSTIQCYGDEIAEIGQGATANASSGTVTMKNGSTIKQIGNISVGANGGTGSFSVLSGSQVNCELPNALVVGGNGGTGVFTVSGTNSLLTFVQNAYVGEDASGNPGTGTLQVDSGGKASFFTAITVTSGGTLNILSGSTLSSPSINIASAGSVNFTGGIINLEGGTLTDAALAMPLSSTLEGTGTLTGSLTSDGTISPGDAPGILNIDGKYIQNGDGALDIGLGGTALGSKYDQLNILGSATLAGTLDVTLLNGFMPTVGNQFTILVSPSEAGQFSSIELPGLSSGEAWNTSQLYTSGSISVVVPEPITPAILLAATALACRRRVKKPDD